MNAETLQDRPVRTLPEGESFAAHSVVMPAAGDRVTDAEHRIHQLGPILAEGGQGAVFTTTIAEVAVKHLRGHQSRPDLADTIGSVSRLPIRDLPIAMPYSITAEWPGYVMTMVRGMQPLGLLRKHSPRQATTSLEWYALTGGLAKRIAVMARISDLLAALHARGVVYGDLNPNNVMVSADADGHEIWLIDTDNMKFADNPLSTPYTPGYAAPEHAAFPNIATFESDAFSLLVVAFETITGLRPFLDGQLVLQTRPGGQAELDAHDGLLPSIIDPQTSNSSDYWLLDREVLLSPRLLELFEQGFGVGRSDPLARPTAGQLGRTLWETLDLLSECTGTSTTQARSCGFTSWNPGNQCPLCNGPAVEMPIVAAGHHRRPSAPIWRGRIPRAGLDVSRRALLLPAASRHRRNGLAVPALRILPDRDGVRLEGLDGVSVTNGRLAGETVVEIVVDGDRRIDLWLESE